MLSLRQLPLRRRLTATLLITCTLSLFVAAIVAAAVQWRVVRARVVRELSAQANSVAVAVRPAVVQHDATAAGNALAGLASSAEIRAAAVHLPDGTRFASYTRAGDATQSLPDAPGEGFGFRGTDLELWQPVQPDSGAVARVFLRRDIKPVYLEAAWPFAGGLAGLVFGTLLSLWLAHGLRRSIGDPVRLLTHAAETVSQKRDYSLRVPRIALNELGGLIDAFNSLMADLAARAKAAEKVATPADEALTDGASESGGSAEAGWPLRVLDGAPEFIAIARADRGMIFLNRAAREKLGLAVYEKIAAARLDNFVGDVRREEFLETILPAAALTGEWSGKLVWIARDGRDVGLAAHIAAHRDAAGAVEFFSIAARDAAAIARAPAALRESVERMRAALDAAQMGTWQWDAVANLVVWDETTLRLFEQTAETFAGTHEAFLESIYPDDRAEVEAALVKSFADGGLHRAEFRVSLPNGGVRWLISIGRVQRDADGRPARMVGVVHEGPPHGDLGDEVE